MKNDIANSSSIPPPADDAFEEQVFHWLLVTGYVIPETPEELQIAEAGAASPPQLPEILRDPDSVLRRIKKRLNEKEAKATPFPLPLESGVFDEFDELGRAARHGNGITNSIEEKMAENRRIADERAVDGEP